MKTVKRMLTLVLALMMVLSLAVSVSANAEVTLTETISVSENDTHTYEVYQIFTGKLSSDGKFSDVQEGANMKEGTDVTAALAALEALANKSNPKATESEILAEVSKYADLSGEPVGTVSKDQSLDVVSGYYLMKDITTLGEGDNYNLHVVKVAGDVTVTVKRGEVTSVKKVVDTNDSTGEVTERQDSADYDIGDAVPFVLSATITEKYADFKTYYLCFHDTCAEGLTFDAGSVEVFVDGTKITSGYEILSGADLDCEDCTFHVEFAELKNVSAVKAKSVITVTYNATLNDDAQLGAVGNSNTLKVQYSNDPNYEADGTPDGETPPSGYTPEDKVVVFTYAVNVDKVDENGAALAGAEFTLYKKLKNEPAEDSNVEYVTETDENDVVTYWQVLGALGGNTETTFTWEGVDDGEYKLVETKTPAGYNTIDPIVFTIEAAHDTDKADPKLTNLSGGEKFEAVVMENEFTGVLTTDVENLPGKVLPETGGMGTTLFYAIGGVLVLVAIVLLVSKKRMASAE